MLEQLFFTLSCQLNVKVRPSFFQIVVELQKNQVLRKRKDESPVKGEPSKLKVGTMSQNCLEHA